MRYISDIEIAEAFSNYRFGDKPDDTHWRRMTLATQLLKLNAGYSVSYSQHQVLKQLKLLKTDNKPNQAGREFMLELKQDKYS